MTTLPTQLKKRIRNLIQVKPILVRIAKTYKTTDKFFLMSEIKIIQMERKTQSNNFFVINAQFYSTFFSYDKVIKYQITYLLKLILNK